MDTYKYEEATADLTQFVAYFKTYMKRLLDYLKEKKPARVDAFKSGAKAFFDWMKLEKNFKEITFYTPRECWDF